MTFQPGCHTASVWLLRNWSSLRSSVEAVLGWREEGVTRALVRDKPGFKMPQLFLRCKGKAVLFRMPAFQPALRPVTGDWWVGTGAL